MDCLARRLTFARLILSKMQFTSTGAINFKRQKSGLFKTHVFLTVP